MFICLTLSIVFIISISNNDSFMISMITKDFYTHISFLSDVDNFSIDRVCTDVSLK